MTTINEQTDGTPVVVSIFSGGGLLDAGLAAAGLPTAVACEKDKKKADIYARNNPTTTLVMGDVSQEETRNRIRESLGGRKVAALVGSPVCTDFSLANKDRDAESDDARLWETGFMATVEMLQPDIFLLENVRLMLTAVQGGERVIDSLTRMAANLGYRVEHKVLDAAAYGTPQHRERAFIIGTRKDVPIRFPATTHGEGLLPYVTAKEAIADLADRPDDKKLGHVRWKHSAKLTAQYDKAVCGEIMIREGRKGTKPDGTAEKRGPLRLHPDRIAPTIRASTGDEVIHYSLPRVITAREAARLQGVPDSFELVGPKTEQYAVVGNGVAFPLAKAWGGALRLMLEESAVAETIPEEALVQRVINRSPGRKLEFDDLGDKIKKALGQTARLATACHNRLAIRSARNDRTKLAMGRAIARFIRMARESGEAQDDKQVYKLIEVHDDCEVGYGELYNYCEYYRLHREMRLTFGRAPAVSCSHYAEVRSKRGNIPVKKQHELLSDAEANDWGMRQLRHEVRSLTAPPDPSPAEVITKGIHGIRSALSNLVNEFTQVSARLTEEGGGPLALTQDDLGTIREIAKLLKMLRSRAETAPGEKGKEELKEAA